MNINKENYQQLYSKYFLLKQQFDLPLKIKLCLSFLESSLQDKANNQSEHHQFSIPMLLSFSSFSSFEKIYFMYHIMLFLKNTLNMLDVQCENQAKQIDGFWGNFSASGQIIDDIFGIGYWIQAKCDYLSQRNIMNIEAKKKSYRIKMKNYFVRKSKKHKNTLVFEAIHEVPSHQRKFYLAFKQSIFSEIYNRILHIVINSQSQQILHQLFIQSEPTYTNYTNKEGEISSFSFLSSKIIKDFVEYKEQISEKMMKTKFNFIPIKKGEAYTIERSKNYRQYFRMECSFDLSAEQLKLKFLKKYQENEHRHMMRKQMVENFSNKYFTVYEKYEIPVLKESRSFEHLFLEEISHNSLENLIFLRSYHWNGSSKDIQFLSFKIRASRNGSRLIVMVKLVSEPENIKNKSNHKKQIESSDQSLFIIEFLKQFYEMMVRKSLTIQKLLQQKIKGREDLSSLQVHSEMSGEIKNTDQKQFSLNFSSKMSHLHDSDNQDVTTDCQDTSKIDQQSQQIYQLPSKSAHLVNQHQMEPQKGIIKQIRSAHFIFDKWYRRGKGGLVCKNKNAVRQQNKIVKHLLKTLGQNALSKKGLLNISLPAFICCTQSHLALIARNFCFSPILLEKAATLPPVERMKYVMLYAISVSIFSINVKKPFNPILGQTYQSWINGCPIYVEQISHHPPISSYYVVGRGYKSYGSIGLKANFGINWIYGFSEQPNYIQFDDGCKIQLNFGKMLISGILFGERQFSLKDKIYAFDATNSLFGQVSFQQKKKLFSSPSLQPLDFIEGHISTVNSKFVQQFKRNDSKTHFPKQNHLIKKQSEIEGIWCGKILFDDQLYFDFEKENACVMDYEQNPLPSDSRFRADIHHLSKNEIKEAQIEKQKLEQIQRKDKKLRQHFLG